MVPGGPEFLNVLYSRVREREQKAPSDRPARKYIAASRPRRAHGLPLNTLSGIWRVRVDIWKASFKAAVLITAASRVASEA
jgi:hypothetical protein